MSFVLFGRQLHALPQGDSYKRIHDANTCQAFDNVQPSEDDPIAELYVEKTGQMSEKDAAFFKKWDTLLTIEEQEIGRFRSQLWTMTSEKREKNGRSVCAADYRMKRADSVTDVSATW